MPNVISLKTSGYVVPLKFVRFCTDKCQAPTSSYQLFHLRSGCVLSPDLKGGRRVCYHCGPPNVSWISGLINRMNGKTN